MHWNNFQDSAIEAVGVDSMFSNSAAFSTFPSVCRTTPAVMRLYSHLQRLTHGLLPLLYLYLFQTEMVGNEAHKSKIHSERFCP